MVRIGVTGVGVRSCFGRGADALARGLERCEPRFVPYEPFARAGLRFPYAAPVDDAVVDVGVARWDDRATRLLEGSVRDALHDAIGVALDDARDVLGLYCDRLGLSRSRVAFVTGTSSAGIGPFCDVVARRDERHRDDARYASATRDVARALAVSGPVLTVCNVCASGAQAIAEACALLANDACDAAIAVGFEALEPFVGAGFDSLTALAARPLPFSAARRGLTLGEAGAALVLVRASEVAPDALRSLRGAITGWGSSSDAHHLTAPDPSGAGVALAVSRALQRSNTELREIGAINAHATATPFNDAMECAALTSVFGARAANIPVYGLKGAFGHTLGAAGAIETVAALRCMAEGWIPPTVTTEPIDPTCDLDVVVAPRRVAIERTLKLSSAFGGANTALVLESARCAAESLR